MIETARLSLSVWVDRKLIQLDAWRNRRDLIELVRASRQLDLTPDEIAAGVLNEAIEDTVRVIGNARAMLKRVNALGLDRGWLGSVFIETAELLDELDDIVEGWRLAVDDDFRSVVDIALTELGVDPERSCASLSH